MQGGYGAGSRSAPTPDGRCLRVPQLPVFPSRASFFALCARGFAAGEGGFDEAVESPAWELTSSARYGPRRTLLAYKREYGAFQRWCQNSGETALPCSRETIVAYVSHLCRTPALRSARAGWAKSTARMTANSRTHSDYRKNPAEGAIRPLSFMSRVDWGLANPIQATVYWYRKRGDTPWRSC